MSDINKRIAVEDENLNMAEDVATCKTMEESLALQDAWSERIAKAVLQCLIEKAEEDMNDCDDYRAHHYSDTLDWLKAQ